MIVVKRDAIPADLRDSSHDLNPDDNQKNDDKFNVCVTCGKDKRYEGKVKQVGNKGKGDHRRSIEALIHDVNTVG